ncbi:hypothetical protein ACFL0T_02935 [Candidatus Omnitrophota bacterium]
MKTENMYKLNSDFFNKRLTIIFWLIALAAGAVCAWNGRYVMGQDGIAYLDVGDAYFRGDLKTAINPYWGPLYSWLLGLAMYVLKPSIYWEFIVVQIVNYLIYICTLAAFTFFLRELLDYRRFQREKFLQERNFAIPESVLHALGFVLFIWSSLDLIGIPLVSPDMCVAFFTYVSSAILLRIYRNVAAWHEFIFFGIFLGMGYLAKSIMFPMALVFFVCAFLATGSIRKKIKPILVAVVLFSAVSGPFIYAISAHEGRLVIGDCGRVMYIKIVNGRKNYPRLRVRLGDQVLFGRPKDNSYKFPAIYTFEETVGVTYPLIYNPSYWYKDTKLRFDLMNQIDTIIANTRKYFRMFFPSQLGLIFGVFMLYFLARREQRWGKALWEFRGLVIPAVFAFGLYGLLYMETRYLGPFFVLLWMGVISGIRSPASQRLKRYAALMVFILCVWMIALIGQRFLLRTYTFIDGFEKNNYGLGNKHIALAKSLRKMDIYPGDRVAVIGDAFKSYWARLAKVYIIAQIPKADVVKFWESNQEVQSQVIKKLTENEVKIVVASNIPQKASFNKWKRVEGTDWYILKKSDIL